MKKKGSVTGKSGEPFSGLLTGAANSRMRNERSDLQSSAPALLRCRRSAAAASLGRGCACGWLQSRSCCRFRSFPSCCRCRVLQLVISSHSNYLCKIIASCSWIESTSASKQKWESKAVSTLTPDRRPPPLCFLLVVEFFILLGALKDLAFFINLSFNIYMMEVKYRPSPGYKC